MLRQLDNLERLCNKLQRRFGTNDPLFLDANAACETHRSAISRAIKAGVQPMFHTASIDQRSSRVTRLNGF